MRALSIRQPWAELILRGVKTAEYRSRPTRIVGERFYIYAAGRWPAKPLPVVGCQLPAGKEEGRRRRAGSGVFAAPDAPPPAWMIEWRRCCG